MRGTIVGLFTAPASGDATVAHDEVEAVTSRGLAGDRYFDANQGDHDPRDEITFIQVESLRQAKADHGVDFAPGEHRRNVVVEGVELLDLIGRTVRVGEAEVEVLAANPPCKYLAELTGKPVLTALRGKGGVRGRIARGGTVRLGDAVSDGA